MDIKGNKSVCVLMSLGNRGLEGVMCACAYVVWEDIVNADCECQTVKLNLNLCVCLCVCI